MKRQVIADTYRKHLNGIAGIRFLCDIEGVDHSNTYFPIFVDALLYGKSRNELYEELKRHNIYGRRYFYPLISQFPTYRGLPSAESGNLPVAVKAAEQILCLPIFPELENWVIKEIIGVLKK